MSGKRNRYTAFGQMLLSVGILNLIVRISTPADMAVSFFFLARGGTLLKDKKWPKDEVWNKTLATSGIIWPLFKLFWIYFYMSDKMIEASNGTLDKLNIMTSSAIFLVPAIIISVAAYIKLQTPRPEND